MPGAGSTSASITPALTRVGPAPGRLSVLYSCLSVARHLECRGYPLPLAPTGTVSETSQGNVASQPRVTGVSGRWLVGGCAFSSTDGAGGW